MQLLSRLKSILLFQLVVICSQHVVFSKDYQKLLTALTKDYNKILRPVKDSDTPVNVSFELLLTKIVKLDIKEQRVDVNARVMMKWQDHKLQWNISEYNIHTLIAPVTLIWSPDIMLYNTAAETSASSTDMYAENLRIRKDGSVVWVSPVTLRSSCDISVRWFPFDEQSCSLIFGSISMPEDKLVLEFNDKPKSVDDFRGNIHYTSGVWALKSIDAEQKSEYYDEEQFSLLKFKLTLRRLPTYYVLYFVLPCLCLSLMSLCIFYIPPDSGERIGFGITVVLAMSVYFLVISEKLPEKSDQIPLIGALYMILFFIMMGTLIVVIFTAHLACKITKPPRNLCHIFYTRCKCNVREQKVNADKGIDNRDPELHVNSKLENTGITDENPREIIENRKRSMISDESNVHKEMLQSSANEDKEKKNQDQWKEIAARIEKIAFRVFTAMTILLPTFITLIFLA